MLHQALEVEVAEYLERHREARDENGHAVVTRHGKARPRQVTIAAGTMPSKLLRSGIVGWMERATASASRVRSCRPTCAGLRRSPRCRRVCDNHGRRCRGGGAAAPSSVTRTEWGAARRPPRTMGVAREPRHTRDCWGRAPVPPVPRTHPHGHGSVREGSLAVGGVEEARQRLRSRSPVAPSAGGTRWTRGPLRGGNCRLLTPHFGEQRSPSRLKPRSHSQECP